ncbi:MAG: TIGR03960 family B12-binding radical SAM protein [Deltaproteobacteria bacterium]|nr:TIGR03960 family B12-binding radical SAM protein [Deltaproteobacteria bacterium]
MPIKDHSLLLKIKHPSRYIGNEINSIRKDPANIDVSMVLAFPDVYEVGMSHQGLKILYKILNGQNWLAAERAFSPWIDLEEELRHRNTPIVTMESDRPLSNFDIIGFSLQHELCYSNVLTMLDLCKIPFLASDRDDAFPLIIAGGPACFNPEPVADIFDAILVGDGEEAALEICSAVRKAKKEGLKKSALLKDLKLISGVYIPSFFKPCYSPEGLVDRIEPLDSDYREVRKALVPDIEKYPFPDDQIVPFASLVHDRLSVEIARGCTRGCRFCQAGMIYRPVRERRARSVIEVVDSALKKTGLEDVSLLSLSSGDYSCIAPLIGKLMDRYSGKRIAVSLPSLRIDSLDPAWLEEIKRVRKTGFTLAPEAGNDRLRRIINKTLTNDDIMNMARVIYSAGWDLIKLYFMVGLPHEDEGDVLDIVRLAKEVAALGKGRGRKEILNVSVAAFVPKSHTPFMWAPQINYEESVRRIRIIKEGLKGTRIRVKWNQPELSRLEGIFSRGDRRLTQALIEAWRLGARFDAWSECFRDEIWKEAFERTGIDMGFYLYRTRHPYETMPWDHIKSGVSADFLKREWERAFEARTTPDCREGCLECGVCDHVNIDPVIHKDPEIPEIEEISSAHDETEITRYRLTFCKTGQVSYLSHLELARLFIRAARRAGLDMVFSKGFHPMPKISFSTALPVGTGSIHETMILELYGRISPEGLKEAMNLQLPADVKVSLTEDITGSKKKEILLESHYQITLEGINADPALLDKFKESTVFPIIKKTKDGEREVDAKPLVKSIAFSAPDTIGLVINHVSGPELKPAYIIKAIFGMSDEQDPFIKVLKTKQITGNIQV